MWNSWFFACWHRDDLAVMEKAKATKAAKLNATRNACKKRSKGIVSELAAAEKQLARPRAVCCAPYFISICYGMLALQRSCRQSSVFSNAG